MQIAVNKEERLGRPSTLCRLEHRVGRQEAFNIHTVLVEQFMQSFDGPPKALVLDFDATDDLMHGTQEGRFFNAY